MWNHMTRYRGGSYERISSAALVRENGATSYVRNQSLINFADTVGGLEPNSNILFMFKSRVLEPARLSGEAVLVHEPIDQVAEPRSAWQYLPGQRRVRRAPMIAYDNSARYSNGLITADNIDGYNGAPDRFDWKLVGKQELFIPYNSYRIGSRDLKYDAVIKPNHVNQDLARYEKHRVWVVEATSSPVPGTSTPSAASMWTKTVGRSPSRTSTTAAVNCGAAVNCTRSSSTTTASPITCWKPPMT